MSTLTPSFEFRMSNPINRRQRRRLLAGERDPVRQNLLNLIDRVEASAQDVDAAQELVAFAKLRPEAFSEDLVNLLLEDVHHCRREPLLQALHEVALRSGKPCAQDLLAIARVALFNHWGRTSATQIFAANANVAMFDDEELMTKLLAAAGPNSISFGTRSISRRPEPMLKLFELASDRMLSVMAKELSSPDSSRIRHAALAARGLMTKHPDAAKALAEPIVGAMLRLVRRHSSEDREAFRLVRRHTSDDREVFRHVLGDTINFAPTAVDVAVDQVWSQASPEEKAALLVGYDGTCRDRLNEIELLPGVATSITKRAMAAIHGRDPDLLLEAASTLELVSKYFPCQVEVPLADAIALLETIGQPYGGGAAPRATQEKLDELALVPYRDIAMRAIEAATVSLARVRIPEFWPACMEAWKRASVGSDFRVRLSHIIAALCRQNELVPAALPVIQEVLESADLNAKSAVLWNIATYRWPKSAVLPAPLGKAVLDSLLGNSLVTLEPAVEAIKNVQLDADQLPTIVERLITVAALVADTRAYHRMADKAIESALMVAKGSPGYDRAKQGAIAAIQQMYPLDAIESLRWRPELQDSPHWVPTAIRCLLRHDNHYWRHSEDHRARLVRELVHHRRDAIESHIETLVMSARACTHDDPRWVWTIADLLSNFGFNVPAMAIAEEAWLAIPDQDDRILKLESEQAFAIYAFEAAIATGDASARDEALRRWRRANAEMAVEWKRTHDV